MNAQLTPSAKASSKRSIAELSQLSAIVRNVAADNTGERSWKLHRAADALYDAGSELEVLRGHVKHLLAAFDGETECTEILNYINTQLR